MIGFPMPQHEENVEKECTKEEKKTSNPPFLVLVLIWFFISGGLEGFFQSQTYTFGICGPHLMEPGKVRF